MTDKPDNSQIKSAAKVLNVLDVLTRNFVHGYSPTELTQATGFAASDISRYVKTLIETGFAERIEETGRVRISVKFARIGVNAMRSVDAATSQVEQLRSRIS